MPTVTRKTAPKQGQRGVFAPQDIVVSVRHRGTGWVALVAKTWGKRPIKVTDSNGLTRSYADLWEATNDFLARTMD